MESQEWRIWKVLDLDQSLNNSIVKLQSTHSKVSFFVKKSYWEILLLTDFRPPFIKNTSVLFFFQYQDLDTFWQQTQSILQPMILIFSFYATNFRFHFHPLHYLHFAPIMNAFSFYFPPFLAFLNAERNMILSVRISQELLSQIKSCPGIQWYVHNSTWFAKGQK